MLPWLPQALSVVSSIADGTTEPPGSLSAGSGEGEPGAQGREPRGHRH